MMPRKRVFVLVGAISLLAMTSPSFVALGQSGGGPITGKRVSFSQPPLWTHSGAWDYQSGNLLLVDVLRSEVRRYDMAGRFVGSLSNSYAKAKGHVDPTIVQNTEAGSVWVEYEDGYIVRLSKGLKATSDLGLERAKNLMALFWWVPLDESNLLAFGDIQKGNQVTGAVLRVPLARPADFEVLREVATDSPAHRFFLIGQTYLAAVRGEPYSFVEKGPVVAAGQQRVLSFLQVSVDDIDK